MTAVAVVAGLFLVLTWLGYPLLLRLMPERPATKPGTVPQFRVTALVAAWNAEKHAAARVRNLLDQTYPAELLDVFIASDGSADGTVGAALSVGSDRVRAKQFPRGGKSSTQNLAMLEIDSDVVVLSDVETTFEPDCVAQLVAPFADPEVGCVTGTMIPLDEARPLSKDQGLYWRFENWLRWRESECGVLVTAAGACMALRRSLFVPLPASRGDDCMIPLDVALQGCRVMHTSLALASDSFPAHIANELRARKRMVSRNLGGIFDRPALLNPFRYPGYAMSLWLHKILRWMTPFLAVLFLLTAPWQYPLVLVPAVLFFALAGVGWMRARAGRPSPRLAAACFSFLVANVGFARGTLHWLSGEKITNFSHLPEAQKQTQSAQHETKVNPQ